MSGFSNRWANLLIIALFFLCKPGSVLAAAPSLLKVEGAICLKRQDRYVAVIKAPDKRGRYKTVKDYLHSLRRKPLNKKAAQSWQAKIATCNRASAPTSKDISLSLKAGQKLNTRFPYSTKFSGNIHITFTKKTNKLKISGNSPKKLTIVAGKSPGTYRIPFVLSRAGLKSKTYSATFTIKGNTPHPTPTPTQIPTSPPVEPTPTITPTSEPTPIPISSRGYDMNAFYVPVADRSSLQSALDQHSIIRLDAYADYATGGLAQLVVRSDQKIYGLPGTVVPPILVSSGTEHAVLSMLQASAVTFPPSATVTHDNLFLSVNSDAYASGSSLENNLFIDWYGGLSLDASSSGFFRNNRFIRSWAHNGANPYLKLKGNSGQPTYGNVFLWYNFLTPIGDSTDISGVEDVTFIGIDAESWNIFNYGNNAVIKTDETVGTLRFFIANGGDNVRQNDPAGTGFFDIGAKNFLLFNDITGGVRSPKMRLRSSVENAVMLNLEKAYYSIYGFQQDSFSTAIFTDMYAPPLSAPADANSLRKSMIELTKDRAAVPWEQPAYDPVPDPAGPNWNQDLSSQPDSTSYIQNLIDNQGIVFLPAGKYYISAPLRLKTTQGIVGAGMEKTVIISKDPTVDMIVGDDHAPTFALANMVLSDLTLQGGANGIHLDPNGSGIGAMYHKVFLSHVSFRDMSNAGIFIDSITAWDNSLIDHVVFSDCGTGFKQRPDPNWDTSSGLASAFVDKTVFYKCQFLRNGMALDLPALRPNGLNMWIENLFSENINGVAKMTANLSPAFVNSDFIGNGGSAVLVNDGANTNLVSSRFIAGSQGEAMLSGAFSIEGTSFRQGPDGNARIILKDTLARYSFYNSTSENMPIGPIKYGYLFNNYFPLDSAFSREGLVVYNGVSTDYLSGEISNAPKPQLLLGAPLEIQY